MNRVSSKVVARLPLDALQFLGAARRVLVETRLASRINAEREIVITVQDTREQARNREIAIERLAELIARTVIVPKGRLKTRPSRTAREARLGFFCTGASPGGPRPPHSISATRGHR